MSQQAPSITNNSDNKKRTFGEFSSISEENNSSSSTTTNTTTTTTKKERKGRKAPHELLTEAEKKANHIASEKKRRQNIRLGFDQLIEIVPSLTQGNRSEAFILQKSVDHIKQLIDAKNDLKTQIRNLQTMLGESNFDEDSSEDDLAY
ncbi:uncharacterized protein BX663DRAFT_528738 [Cokeromyces recurvatus]|uniref:uncharacterized protein n=1 Tax=Cokeromyces recurvatus TaxID=90255 RepID=UPI002221274C|nr:uncharacterized protein BX663DRAFT_528738 [Cokeromyces recurvatus]KAI7908277.1 hypothetical protein BX663DRAFT_528738 [Cokeromyces recurvatus]